MNKTDEYWFWTITSITESIGSGRVFFYDTEDDKLFGPINRADGYEPFYRNGRSKNDSQSQIQFEEKLAKVYNSYPSLILLPRLSFELKRDFLLKFISNIENDSVRSILMDELSHFSENDTFNFKTDLKSLDSRVYLKYDIEKGKFCVDNIKLLYEPFGMSHKRTEVLW